MIPASERAVTTFLQAYGYQIFDGETKASDREAVAHRTLEYPCHPRLTASLRRSPLDSGESALTRWSNRDILRHPGCSCLRRILGIGLHPYESRKTSQTVVCTLLLPDCAALPLSLDHNGAEESSG